MSKWLSKPERAESVNTERTDRANAYRSERRAWAVKVDPESVRKFDKRASLARKS